MRGGEARDGCEKGPGTGKEEELGELFKSGKHLHLLYGREDGSNREGWVE